MNVEWPKNAEYVRGQLRRAEIAIQDMRVALRCMQEWMDRSQVVIYEQGKPLPPVRDALLWTAIAAYTSAFNGYANFDADRFDALKDEARRDAHDSARRFRDKLVAHTDVGELGKRIRFERTGDVIQAFITHDAVSQVILDGLHDTARAVHQELREYRGALADAVIEHDHPVYDCERCEDRRKVLLPAEPPRTFERSARCPDCSSSGDSPFVVRT